MGNQNLKAFLLIQKHKAVLFPSKTAVYDTIQPVFNLMAVDDLLFTVNPELKGESDCDQFHSFLLHEAYF